MMRDFSLLKSGLIVMKRKQTVPGIVSKDDFITKSRVANSTQLQKPYYLRLLLARV